MFCDQLTDKLRAFGPCAPGHHQRDCQRVPTSKAEQTRLKRGARAHGVAVKSLFGYTCFLCRCQVVKIPILNRGLQSIIRDAGDNLHRQLQADDQRFGASFPNPEIPLEQFTWLFLQ
jgi:hypothetical protein